ncbi:nudix hydrolase 15, mitochondrial isoform X3 [Hevea brasiliensis]|uniref:nudix hydrolase 15, mitochondrial isoform X3 n=1 Tax=Hevea brasiliensis TaxID=3981 RepID=UPI0025FB760A|nr:nudix hydrolase 15, mitochondrial isoform X3 [Hevea brasiliensis]
MGEKSQKLLSLAQQLRLYKPLYSLNDPTKEQQQQGVPEEGRNSVSQNLNSTTESAGINNRAAVLICIFEGNDSDMRVILTKRSSTLSSHSGEVALPGGKREEGDADDIETALREAKEEIGLDPSLVDVVAVLEPFITLDENRRAEGKQRMGYKYLLHFFDYQSGSQKFVIWALTAGIMIRVASIVYQRAPTFSEQRPPFWTGVFKKGIPKL